MQCSAMRITSHNEMFYFKPEKTSTIRSEAKSGFFHLHFTEHTLYSVFCGLVIKIYIKCVSALLEYQIISPLLGGKKNKQAISYSALISMLFIIFYSLFYFEYIQPHATKKEMNDDDVLFLLSNR